MRVAFLSGGKDSLFAAYLSHPIDYAVLLVYDFPRPSPHLVNLGKSIETILLTNTPVVTARLQKGKEKNETIRLLSQLGATVIIAGDVYVEDHLRYMEDIANAVGAKLREPLWGMEPMEVLYQEVEAGFRALIVGVDPRLKNWLGKILDSNSVDSFVENASKAGIDVLGERGEYHTVVVSSPLHKAALSYSGSSVEVYNDYLILRIW